MQTGPSPAVLDAFGATAPPVLLDGGRGRTWRSGEIVLKPVDHPAETAWRADVLAALPETDAIRVPRPLPTRTGTWTADGWEAAALIPGRTDPKRWNDAIEAGEAFHEAIGGLARPAFLDTRDDWWSRADHDSWNPGLAPADPTLRTLAEARTPVALDHQLVHGDLLGNVLYEPGLPPAIIDWPPYWRPRSWAAAVAAVDAMCWNGADESVLDHWSHLEAWPQMALRALLYRMITDQHATPGPWRPHPAYHPVTAAVLRRL
ncbi:TIGR02569 family protein [Glycomyces terrestris]|uniref:TIGR02569 family protein n=1 Tax=Glycomyces terrestris TaxID=2493553 RepID=A0A426URK0_9ACTN|nr:TIGR02569 family protein [Glycomyces terrestris]RRR95795.1 TIGR02569 family protein [Glycomyces terrestris]